jgi:hypothetical protein
MSWLLKNKLLVLLFITGIAYWINNPAGRFGVFTKGLVIYNRIPVPFLDCYIDPAGKLYLQADLSEKGNVNYWYKEHFSKSRNNSSFSIPFFIGVGFDDTASFILSDEMLNRIRQKRFDPEQLSSPAAIGKFNRLREAGKPAGLLLKVK